VAGDDGRPKSQGVREGREVRREILRAVARQGAICVAVTPLRQSESAKGIGQVRQHALEGARRVSDAMQKQNGNARRISLLDIVELNPA
jgi:hypothetical protein